MKLSVITAVISFGFSALAVKPVKDDKYEENDSWQAAYDGLSSGVWLSELGELGQSVDDDWYLVSVTDSLNRRIQIDCRFTHAEGDIDFVLFDADLNVVGQDAMSVTDNEYIDLKVPAVGSYYLKIWNRSDYTGNYYNLMWKALPTGEDNYEPNNTMAEAYGGLPENTWLSSIDGFGFQCDDDWYKITVSDDLRRRVVVDCTFVDAEGDIDMIFYDDSGEQLYYVWTDTDNECIDYVVPKIGTYYVKVCFENKGNAYDLHWKTVEYTPPVLTSLAITGGSELNENSSASYVCTATFSDASTLDVTADAVWGENSTYTSFSSPGVLLASSVSSDVSVTLSAAYGDKDTSKLVTVKDVPPVVISLSISGSSEVNENSSATYTCSANWSDGSQSDVSLSATWSEDSSYASIDAGVLNTDSVFADSTAHITAAFGGRSAGMDVTILSTRSAEVTYMDWVFAQEVPPLLSDHADIVADDGIPNLIKYACGLPAHEYCTAADYMSVVKDTDGGMFSIIYNRSASAVDVILEVMWAPTPAGPWFPVEMTEFISQEGDLERWKASIPLMDKGFMRLRATSDGEIFL